MATITTRSGKGSPLTHNEVDANFNNLNNDKLEASNLAAGTGISISGSTITNSSPDQTVAITGSGIASVSGTYPNFDVSVTALQSSDIGSTVQAYDSNLTSFVSTFTLPTIDGTSGQALATNASGTLSFVDVASDPTLGTLTKSFSAGESAILSLSSSVSPTAFVAVTKEIAQTGFSSKGTWDVSATADNYDLYDEAPATSLSLSSASADGTATLGTGSFSASDVGKRIFVDDGGEATLTSTGGAYAIVSTFGSTSYTSGNWSLSGLDVDATNGITLSGINTAGDISLASYLRTFSLSAQESYPQGIFFKSDGTRMYITGSSGDDVNEYNLSTAWNTSTAVYSRKFSVSSQDTFPYDVFFSPDGTKMFIAGAGNTNVYRYNLGTAWNVTTAVYNSVFSLGSSGQYPAGLHFKSDGTKMYILADNTDVVREYNLSTAWNITTASYLQNFSVAAQDTSPTGLFFRSDGAKMYITGNAGQDVNEYDLSTAWNVTTASYLQNFNVSSQQLAPTGVFFHPLGIKMYISGYSTSEVNEYDVGEIYQPTGQYLPALTSTGGQIDSQYWVDINSMTADDVDNDGEVYYSISTDDHITWSIAKASDGVRPIVRNNGGTWEYNTNATYASTTWASATTNNEFAALAQAMTVAANQMDKVQLDAVADGSHFTLGDTLDLAIIPYLGAAGTAPTSDAATINYDSASLNKGAILGTDYDYDVPAGNSVRITSLAAQNLKVRIV
tara:strand:- start:54 stop:2243 length:2190 start_codon:yes stop_codon:yes gene_type:complete